MCAYFSGDHALSEVRLCVCLGSCDTTITVVPVGMLMYLQLCEDTSEGGRAEKVVYSKYHVCGVDGIVVRVGGVIETLQNIGTHQ